MYRFWIPVGVHDFQSTPPSVDLRSVVCGLNAAKRPPAL
jgi:hypothetical protein